MQVPHSLLTCYTCRKTFTTVRGLGYHKTRCYGKKRGRQPPAGGSNDDERKSRTPSVVDDLQDDNDIEEGKGADNNAEGIVC